jgi:ParB family transcriptional regulator, chromosome partitioning protein
LTSSISKDTNDPRRPVDVKDPKRRALGRGLDALLPPSRPPQQPSQPIAAAAGVAVAERAVFLCALEKLVPQKGQPRQHFDAEALEELAASIREYGVLEPILVRRRFSSGDGPGQDRFEIIAGERRWRAAQKAGLREVMVVVKDVAPDVAFELALIENVQREDLNAIELAEALGRLVKEHDYTQESLADRLGKNRTTIANSLRLLKLPARVRSKVITGELSEGHARALLGATTEAAIEALAEKVLRGRLSVRATEALVRKQKSASKSADPKDQDAAAKAESKSTHVRDLETRLMRALGTKVHVRDEGNKGEIAIPYADLEQLDRILDKII